MRNKTNTCTGIICLQNTDNQKNKKGSYPQFFFLLFPRKEDILPPLFSTRKNLYFFFQKNTEKPTAEREIFANFAFVLYSKNFMNGELRVIISGGGTGGHIFPAVSIANAIREKRPDAQILFVGAEGRMEMQRVPAAGYEIKGLPVAGFNRKQLWKNIAVLMKLYKSRKLAKKIIKDFHPMVAVGVGGYASGPTLNMAQKMGIPTLLQEQNSYAGVTNKLLAKGARRICVAYEGMERFFPAENIILTGNPVRQNLIGSKIPQNEALEKLGMEKDKRTVLIVGGSLGARALNESVLSKLSLIRQQKNIQFIWQTGKFYSEEIHRKLEEKKQPDNLYVTDFISDMNVAYSAANLVVSRAGAGSISEFCLLGKPVILVPSPNVAEDHQTKNAMALVQKDAALYTTDAEAQDTLLPMAINTVTDDQILTKLSQNILALAHPNAASDIAEEVIRLAQQG